MTAAEQLAEMAEQYQKSNGHYGHWHHRQNEYRAVLRWFASEVEKRLEDKLCKCSYCYEFRGRHMTELLRELSIDSEPESRCCRICGEVIKGVIRGVPEADGLCGLCYDDQLNKRAMEG